MTKKDIYSRPSGKLKKIYPVTLHETKTTVALIMSPAEAAKMAVALIGGCQMVTDNKQSLFVTVWLKSLRFSVTVK